MKLPSHCLHNGAARDFEPMMLVTRPPSAWRCTARGRRPRGARGTRGGRRRCRRRLPCRPDAPPATCASAWSSCRHAELTLGLGQGSGSMLCSTLSVRCRLVVAIMLLQAHACPLAARWRRFGALTHVLRQHALVIAKVATRHILRAYTVCSIHDSHLLRHAERRFLRRPWGLTRETCRPSRRSCCRSCRRGGARWPARRTRSSLPCTSGCCSRCAPGLSAGAPGRHHAAVF